MPTDEQRMRFEEHYKRLYPDAHLGRGASGDYTNGLVLLQWDMWQAAYTARDAEVQALREENGLLSWSLCSVADHLEELAVDYDVENKVRALIDELNTEAIRSREVDAWQARDAEVQALREALAEIAREDACVYEPSEYERGYSNALCDMGEIARAALAGGEEGEVE